MSPRLDWLLLTSGILYVLALHAGTKLKTASILADLDVHLAPDWYFGGLYKTDLQTVSLFGGVIGAAQLAYHWFYLVGWWSTAIFLAFLYLKYVITARRSLRLAIGAIPAGWKSPDPIDTFLKISEEGSKASEALGDEIARLASAAWAEGKPVPWLRQREYTNWVMRVLEYAIRKVRWGRLARWDR